MPIAGALNSFARLEALASSVGMAHLSNASAVWRVGGQGAPVVGIRLVFDRSFGDFAGDSVNDSDPVASVFAADVPGIARNDSLAVTRDGESVAMDYRVVRATPDGSGWVQLQLQELPA